MSKSAAHAERRNQILRELSALHSIRRGSVTEQIVEVVGKDGQRHTRGPYPVYTFKDGGKTISRRLSRTGEVAAYRQQIEAGRRFQELTRELMRIGEAHSNEAFDESAQKKTLKPLWKRRSRPHQLSGG